MYLAALQTWWTLRGKKTELKIKLVSFILGILDKCG